MNNGFYEFSRGNQQATSSVFPYTGSAVISGSLQVTGSVQATQGFIGSLQGTASFAASASWAPSQVIDTGSLVTTSSFNVFTSSYGTGSFTGSFVGSLQGTASFAISSSQAISSSYAQSAQLAPNYLPLTGGTITGDLTVIGTASFAYTTASVVSVGTNIIVLNTDNPASRFGGITVVDSGSFGNSSTGSLLWDSQNNRWIYSNPSGSSYDGGMLISGPRNTSGLGNETGMDANFIAVGQGADHIRPGSIYNSGSITIVTGSLTVTQGITGSLEGTASFAATASIAPSYLPIAVPQTTGLVISFTQDRVYGTFASPETGSIITSDTGSAILGVTNLIIHSASAAPTTGSDFKKLTGSSNYVAGLNYIYCTYIADNQIIYSISQAT